uniref:Adenylosuccinate lyase n=1 Tax=Globodera pallida TaxID=36090 RepID=A0A183C7T9_GLOPA
MVSAVFDDQIKAHLFELMDIDNNGFVSVNEMELVMLKIVKVPYVKLFRGKEEGLSYEDTQNVLRSKGFLMLPEEGFAEIDRNHDGRLTLNELRQHIHAVAEDVDTDGDGLISGEEYKLILNQVRDELRFRGVKGAVGTQDALLQLFDGDAARAKALDAAVAEKAGFGSRVFGVCGQTYPRYQDSDVLFALSSLASAAAKFASDLRILQAFGEMSEPFDAAHQVGSSAMPYKRNPMLCERICGIARYMMVNSLNPLFTFAEQGFERTLDDSANRRIVLPDAFLGADAILSTLQRVFEGMRVYESVVRTSVHKSGALLERALMLLTQRDGNRQEAHESIRQIAMNGVTGDDLLGALPAEIRDDLRKLIDQPLLMCGRAEQQTRDFLANELRPTIAKELGKVSDDDKQKTMVLDV